MPCRTHKSIAYLPLVVVALASFWIGSHRACADESNAGQDEKLAFFENRIRPLLAEHCMECHGEQTQEGQLRLDSRAGWEQGGKSGAAIVPGLPEKSLIVQAVRHADKDLQMPPDSRLSNDDITAITQWVLSGAIDPRNEALITSHATIDNWTDEFQTRLDWWSLRPLSAVPPPLIANTTWSLHPVDCFLYDRLNSAGLEPAGPADVDVLLRRLSFVLTGLPPSIELRKVFHSMHDRDAPAAINWLVDQLLESPHFGEHMARHWMDAVRYTDTYGYEWDNPAKGSHEYRDYLIRAFNEDLPFDTFVREQLAGDLLPVPRINEQLQINESVIGPMFYHLGEHRHGSSLAFNGIHQEMVNNKVDAFSKVFLATTVSCARCHDHKREPVSQKDYYALGAVFMTPRWASRPADAPKKNSDALQRLDGLRAAIGQQLRQQWRNWKLDPAAIDSALDRRLKSEPPTPSKLEDISYPLIKLWSLPSGHAEMWSTVTAEYLSARDVRQKRQADFLPLGDVQHAQSPSGWVMEGEGIETGWVNEGEILVALDGNRAIGQLLNSGWHTHALSSKLPGVLRMPPQHTVPGKIVSLLIAGGEYSGALVLDENSFQNETVTFFNQPQPGWQSYVDANLSNGVTRVTIDFATSSLNPNFPPRTGLAAGLPSNDLGFDKRSWLSILDIVSHNEAGAPSDALDAFSPLLAMTTPATHEQMRRNLVDWLSSAVTRWCEGRVQSGDVALINWMLSEQVLFNDYSSSAELMQLVDEYRRVESAIEFPRTVNSMDERQVSKAGLYFNVRGNVDAMGEQVMPDSLQMFTDHSLVSQSPGSGRLELANSLLRVDHPLTTRVYVNRVWQWIFGEGLVSTPDDFGRLGDQPSHPDLLDWLARDFECHGWSTKYLVRQLVLTQAFQQSGEVSERAAETDPQNRLRHHYPTRRLEAEAIRDSLLCVSGRLDRRLYGRPINPPRLVEDASKRLYSGPVDGLGRRSLYLKMSIMAPPKFLTTFDLPDLKLPSGKRSVTSVPAQALQLLNDPLVNEVARHWSESLLVRDHHSVEERLVAMFLEAYSRLPDSDELTRWIEFVDSQSTRDNVMCDAAIWCNVAHTIFNTKEFIYYR